MPFGGSPARADLHVLVSIGPAQWPAVVTFILVVQELGTTGATHLEQLPEEQQSEKVRTHGNQSLKTKGRIEKRKASERQRTAGRQNKK